VAEARALSAWRTYWLLAGMWVRSAMAYRTSFVIMTVSQFGITVIDFVAVIVMFTHVSQLGGFRLSEVALLFGTASLSFGLSDLAVGNVEHLGQRVRNGTFDQMLVRPISTIVSMAADQFAIRRVGRIAQALLVLCWALANVDIDWTIGRVAMLPLMIVSGAVIYASVFVLGAAVQFWSSDSAEVANAFTYGGSFLAQYPMTIYPGDLVRGVTFVMPMAFVNWYPTLYILRCPDPLGLPTGFRYASPVVAMLVATLAWLAWREGVRRYRSTGS
jgi:ABC-2 type transport system permease protein